MGAPQQRAVGSQKPAAPSNSQERGELAMAPPHEPSGLPANGTSPTPPQLLKVLQASTSLAPQGVVQPQNGSAAPVKGAAAWSGSTAPAPAAPGTGAPAAASVAQPQVRVGKQNAVPTPVVQPTAASMAASPPLIAAAAAPAEVAQQPGPGPQASDDLEGILARIMNLDAEGWFRHPVRESDAPNYYKLIKRPMCFEVMRSKMRGGHYVNWQEVVRDFELICSNAMKYNQRRSRVHKQALVMLRAGKKLLVEMEAEGRRAVAALVAMGGHAAAPASVQFMPADSQAVPSSLYCSVTAGGTPVALLRSQSTADTATTEADESEDLMRMDATSALPAEEDMDTACYSSYEETDLEDEEEAESGIMRRQQQLLQYARDAVLVQLWDGTTAAAAALPAAAPAEEAGREGAEGQQHGQQPAAVPEPQAVALAAGPAHSREWKQVRRGVEWRVRWLEHRLNELQHQRQRYQQQLAAEQQREATQAAAEQKQQEARQEGGDVQAAAVAQQELAAPPLRMHHPRLELPELQLPGLLQHPFIAEHSVLGARQQAEKAAAAGDEAAAASEPVAMDCDNFPAEAYAALELLDQRLSSLRRQLVALQKPAAQATMQHMHSVRVPGYRGGGGVQRRASGGFTPRASGGFTPRGTPRSGSFHRDSSLAKRRRVQEFDVGELVTPLGAPKFVERAQVKTIDTPRVRTLPASELKKRQAAIDAYDAQLKKGSEDKAGSEAISALCPGEESSDEDTSDEAYLSRHEVKEKEERMRYEAVLGVAVKKNKHVSKVSKERTKHSQLPRPPVPRTVSAPALVGSGSDGLGSPTASLLPGAASAPIGTLVVPAIGSAPAAGTPAGSKPPAQAAGAQAAGGTPSTAGTGLAAAASSQHQHHQQLVAAVAAAAAAAQQQSAALPPMPAPAGKQPSAAAGSLTGPNGLPLVMIPMNAAMAAHMAQQMVAAAAAANAGKGSGGAGGSASAAAAAAAVAATSAAMMRPPFNLTPAMAAAMAAASGNPLAAAAQQAAMRQAGAAMAAAAAAASAADAHNVLPPALQAIIPNGPPEANGGGGSGSSKSRGRPARHAGRPRR